MFTEFKCKTNFSFLRGATAAQDYIRRAAELGCTHITISDVNGVYALPRAYEALRALREEHGEAAPLPRLIAGAELTMENHPPLTLIAQTRAGYGLLCRLITRLHAGHPKGEGRLSLADLAETLTPHPGRPGLVCLAEPGAALGPLKELFPGRLYIPLCRYLDGRDFERTEAARAAAAGFDLPLVATNDVHYHTPERRPLQDALTCIREGCTVDDAGFRLFGNGERYLKSDRQMRALFHDLPGAIAASEEIAAGCVFSLEELKYTYPHEFIPPGHTPRSYLEELVLAGARRTYKGSIPEAAARQIQRELDFFAKRGDEHYFLTVHDVVRFARENNIICQGRGSAANSIVCYVLGITSIDPIKMNLLFDRFMNEGRRDPPDIDIDFEHERREEVIQYIYNRFGRHRAAMVAAVRTYRSKSCFLELSKALGLVSGTISAGELEQRLDELAGARKPRLALVEKLTAQMKKFPRHLSIHSGGFVLSEGDLCELVPIEPARMEGRTIIQWDKDDLETLGLMKIDILSIGFLTALHKAADLAGMSWREIPLEDRETYAMIQRAETHGTFQIESRAQIAMLTQTLPENYYDLVVQVALVRPSPTEGGMVKPYIKGLFDSRRGKRFSIGHPKLDYILGRTHGVPIFQEQIMQISIEVAGFTPAEADQLRRSLGLQRSAESVNVMGEKLRLALLREGIPADFAARLFEYIKGYAHYGFPESHAASYADLAYKSAYMKCHHPAELVCALINSQPMGFYSVDTLIAEARRNSGVSFLPAHPNHSGWDCTIEGEKTVRMGFRSLRQINRAQVERMCAVRAERPFTGIEDFIFRTGFGKDVLENMAISGSFTDFGLDRRHSFWQSIEFTNLAPREAPQLPGRLSRGLPSKPANQLSLFNEKLKLGAEADLFTPMRLIEEIEVDHRKLGYSLHGSIMRAVRQEVPGLPPLTSVQLRGLQPGSRVRYAGLMAVLQMPPPARGTAFITLEDEFGTVDSVVRAETFEKYEEIIRGSRYLIFTGRLQKKGRGCALQVEHVESFARRPGDKPIGNNQGMGLLRW